MTLSKKDIQRFWSKVDIRSESECWEWTAGKNPNGYGQFSISRTRKLAHRFSYYLNVGKLPTFTLRTNVNLAPKALNIFLTESHSSLLC